MVIWFYFSNEFWMPFLSNFSHLIWTWWSWFQEKDRPAAIIIIGTTSGSGATVFGQKSCLFSGIRMLILATFFFPFPMLSNFPMELHFPGNPVVVFPMVVFSLILQVRFNVGVQIFLLLHNLLFINFNVHNYFTLIIQFYILLLWQVIQFMLSW